MSGKFEDFRYFLLTLSGYSVDAVRHPTALGEEVVRKLLVDDHPVHPGLLPRRPRNR